MYRKKTRGMQNNNHATRKSRLAYVTKPDMASGTKPTIHNHPHGPKVGTSYVTR